MTYISVYVTLEEATHKWATRKMAPGGTIVVTDECGDAVYYKYSRKTLLNLCQAYYMNPECRVLIDPYIVGINRYQEKYAHQELGFIMGCAQTSGIHYKIIYKRTYYRYFGLLPTVENTAYAYCLANYPTLQFMYKFKDEVDADRACSAYLMTRYMEAKIAAKKRWDEDLQYIIEELDDATEECDL